MVRVYQKRSNCKSHDHETILEALKKVRKGDRSLRNVAKEYGISATTLSYHNRKHRNVDLDNEAVQLKQVTHQVLSKDLEKELVLYLLHNCADSNVGLNSNEVRKVAYKLAVANKVNIPISWSNKRIAGPEWFNLFMKRHPVLSAKVPEVTSLVRVSNFNKKIDEPFFCNYKKVLNKYNFKSEDIYNMDVISFSAANEPNKIVGPQEKKQIGSVTSSEKGEQLTLAATVNAAGNALPPFFIFPCVYFNKDYCLSMLTAPTGSVGVANQSGSMTKETCLQYLQYFSNHSGCNKNKPVLLLLASSHVSLDSIKYSKENGIVMLMFPPHCIHKLQPLDRSVFGPLKAAMNKVQNEWMTSNSKKIMKITHIPAFVNQIYTQVFTQKNIQNGFKVAGIHPLHSHSIFQESNFAANKLVQPQNNNDTEIKSKKSNIVSKITVPIELRSLPFISPCKEVRINKKSKTITLTNTQKMVELEEKELNKEENLKRKSDKASKTVLKKIKIENGRIIIKPY